MRADTNRRHLVFIVNPASGTDRLKAVEEAIGAGLDAQRYSWEIQHTRYAKHGLELAREAAQRGAWCVVAVGGDGSVNDVADGLRGTGAVLGIVPKGSGNGLARSLGIPLDLPGAVAVLNGGASLRMDLGLADGRLFLSNAGVGFDALISRAFARSKRRGLAAYSWLVTRHLWTFREPAWKLELDGVAVNEKAFLINVANGQQFGYNFQIAPQASFTDGWLDVVVIRRFPKILGGMLVWRAMHGSILRSPYVKTYKARRIRISAPELKLLQTDGDAHPCNEAVDFEILPAALEVLVPS